MTIHRLLGATALASTLLISSAAFAQDTTAIQAVPCQTDDTRPECVEAQVEEERQPSADIVVTGSRIRSPNITSDVPITSLGGEAIFQQSDQNVGELLNDLPQLASTFSQQNPGLGIGIAGLNLLDLRGLGTQRTLVLVNGRRHVAADILNNAVSPDVSSIPNDLIERVDIVTGGNSAVYGSDAIAGVVNFVLRRSFDGVQLRGSASINEKGFGGSQYLSAMAGKNFADGRGNITLHGEYSRQERVFASQVPYFNRARGLFTVDADGGTGLVNGGDGFPDSIFLQDVRSGTIDYRGLIPINQRAGANGACGNATLANNGPQNSNGLAFSCAYIFSPEGRLTEQTGSRFGTGINASRIGGNGQTGREFQTVSILPQLERYNFNLLGRFELAPEAEFFVEAKFARLDSVGNNAGPSFIQTGAGNQGNVGDFRERPRLDNPFLNPADRTTLANLILASGCNTSLTAACPAAGNLTAAQQAEVNAGTYRFILARNLLDVGLRDEVFRRDTYRVVAGFRGTFNDDWSYEVSGNYGRFDQSQSTNGYIDRQRFSLSMDAARNAAGQIVCRSQIDPAAAVISQRTTDTAEVRAANQARLAADIAACRPYNPFGTPDNTAAVQYFTSTFGADASLEQIVGQAFVSGDLSQLFELPGGPIRFAVGGEYRREKAFYEQDPFTTQGFNNAVSIPVFDPEAFEVKEGFAEIQIPLLKETPFFHELTLNGAGRVSDYGGSVGTVYAYNGGFQWAPVRDLRIRGNYARAVRAPNVSETGFPLVPNFTSISDPCNIVNINSGSTTRRANCTTQVGAGNLANLGSVTYSLPIVSGSNPNLSEETSDSYTLGAVFQPSFVPGLALTVDYFNITVNDIISSVGAQTILNNCVDLPTLTNIFCQQYTRFAGPGLGPNGEQPGAILGNSLIVAPLNFAKREREGIDVNLQYRTRLGADGRLNANLIYVHSLANSNFEDPTNPDFENRILGETGYPQDEFRLDLDLGYQAFTFGYRLRFIGEQYLVAYESVNGGINGLPPSNIDAAEPNTYPIITYSDLRFEWDTGWTQEQTRGAKGLLFYAGVDNVFNQLPPLGTTATGVGTAIYDYRGRSFYAGARVRF
ncbi:TonB-dependent Receptor Plug Domain [Sphingomonas guangdongensis]|uniref:TonB-dependent Receptor Plug Domain n=1 Tax=Sphingomonas guangdongensis TaxID=1141890 RepID=A0A285QBD0_9SPHN|nr:TonB-dependent receptor [Sphingomonas guangdongensis]SOB78784.1 TonB-dependent Receptor Plug Domain [Sphingomonas guangdongensis]